MFSPSKSSTGMNKQHSHPKDTRSSTEMSTFVPVLLKLGVSFSLFYVLTIQDAASLSPHLLATECNALKHERQNNSSRRLSVVPFYKGWNLTTLIIHFSCIQRKQLQLISDQYLKQVSQHRSEHQGILIITSI